jgi:hypothetical protein
VVGAALGIGRTVQGQAQVARGVPASTAAARELAAALFEERRWDEAERIARAITGREDAQAQDFVDVACVIVGREFDPYTGRNPEPQASALAIELCAEALRRDPESAAANYVSGVAAWMLDPPHDSARARAWFERTVELAPSDPFARYHLGSVLLEGESPATERAMVQFARVVAMGNAKSGVSYRPALYHLGQLLRKNDPTDERGLRLLRESAVPRRSNPRCNATFLNELSLGRLAHISSPRGPGRTSPNAERPDRVAWKAGIDCLEEAGPLRAIDVGDVDGDRRTDIVGVGGHGVWIALQRSSGAFESARVTSGEFDHVLVVDLDHRFEDPFSNPFHPRGSVLAYGRSGVKLLFAQATGWFSDDSANLPSLGPVSDAQSLDFDHDGVLDVLFATDGGIRLLRNRGPATDITGSVVGPVRLDDATEGAELAGAHADWLAIEDFDGDGNVDVLAGGAGDPTLLFRGSRRGRFERAGSKRTGLPDLLPSKPLLADFGRDGDADVIAGPLHEELYRGRGDGTFEPGVRCAPLPRSAQLSGLVDVDLDGQPDAVFADEKDGLCFVSGVGRPAGPEPIDAARIEAPKNSVPARTPVLDDLDLDGAIDVVAIGKSGVRIITGRREPDRPHCQLLLRGRFDNRFALGAIVEVRGGASYERRFVTRPDQLFFLSQVDADAAVEPMIRIHWPNGVVQYPLQSIAVDEVKLPFAAPSGPVDLELPVKPNQELRLLIAQSPTPIMGA